MSNPIPGQANVRTAVLRDHSNDPITTGTVHYYLMALTGTNAGLHYVYATHEWTFNEVYYDAVTEPTSGQVWSIEVESAAWDNGVQYAEYFVDAAGRNIQEHVEFICQSAVGGSGGSGLGTHAKTVEVKDDGDNPIAGVRVVLTTDAAGENSYAELITNGSGVAGPFMLEGEVGNEETYYVWRSKAGYTFTNPGTLVVPAP